MSKLSNSVIGLLVALSFNSQAVTVQTCQTDNIPATTPSARFTVHGDGTVTDKATGLMWKQCSEGQSGSDCATGAASGYTWRFALQRAATVNSNGFAGYSDWRLPNIKELRSIVERQCIEPSINLTVFPATPVAWFWSSSLVVAYDGNAFVWRVNFNSGSELWDTKDYTLAERLVRSGQ